MAFNYSTNLTEGTVDTGSGVYQGTIGYNTPPTVSSGNTATATFSNDNYRKRLATRYDDLVVWYPFDEGQGATATDYSINSRDGTLKNMTASNRVGGKIGGALSFDTPGTKLSGDSTGQYVDMGTWSFGGAHTLAAWVKADEWREWTHLMSLGASDVMNIRMLNTNGGSSLGFEYKGTLGGDETFVSGESYLQWNQWVHIALTLEDDGANNSVARWYKNGSIYATSSANNTAPDSLSRTAQYLGRANWTSPAYFAGDLDEFRLYQIALSADEVNQVYSESNSTTWYTIGAINNPTSFSATGLPTGLNVNSNTGEISGHTTSAGEHNVTVIASNLSGSDSKVITLTVNPAKPLLESAYTVTRQSDLLGWLKFDEASGTTATNYGSEGSAATLKNGAVFSVLEKKFGASSLNIPTGSTGAYAEITTPISVGASTSSDPYSLSTWFKDLYDYSDNSQGWRTLTRGSNSHHHVIIGSNNDNLGSFSSSGDVFNDSQYDLHPESSDTTWQHIVVTFDGSVTRFYIDGSYVGFANVSVGDNIYAVGNLQSGNQRFAEYLDDFRVYGVVLTPEEVADVYGNGNGDVFPVTSGSSYATATSKLLETGGADTYLTVVYDTSDKGTNMGDPSDLSNLSLWLDASDLASAGSSWSDKSGNNNHATKYGSPSIITNAQNGKSIMRYSADDQYHGFPEMTDIRTVFWVVKRSGSDTGHRFLLGHNTAYNFHGNGLKLWSTHSAVSNVTSGTTRLNGSVINGTTTNAPTSLSILSVKTTGNVSADSFSKDRTITNRGWKGDLGELIIYNAALSDADVAKVESYLATKWGLTSAQNTFEPFAWANSYTLPNTQSAGDIALTMNGRPASTNYVFRVIASNSAGTVWSDAYSVLTNSQAQPPAISASAASSVAGTTATANGNLLSYDGSDQPEVRMFYGDDIDFQVGWKQSHLTGDLDSGISSDYTYTAAVNFHGTNQTVNGVTFTGTTATSGTGWAITAGLTSSVGASSSTVQGTIGAMLDQGFKYAGDPQKIKMTGLTDGQAYVFAFYNQAWGGIRNIDVSCSDLAGSIRINQDQYDGQTFDGLLVECTYIADGTEAEFTFDGVTSSTLHLYAFSNRVATSASNTNLGNKSVGAFTSNLSSLTAGTRYEYAFVATNNGGSTQSGTSNFVTLGLPQVLTPGATDVTKTSATINADLNSTGGVTYTTGAPFSSSNVTGQLMSLDGNDPDADGTPNTTV